MHITGVNIRKQAQKYGAHNILRVFEKFYLRGDINDHTFQEAYYILRTCCTSTKISFPTVPHK